MSARDPGRWTGSLQRAPGVLVSSLEGAGGKRPCPLVRKWGPQTAVCEVYGQTPCRERPGVGFSACALVGRPLELLLCWLQSFGVGNAATHWLSEPGDRGPSWLAEQKLAKVWRADAAKLWQQCGASASLTGHQQECKWAVTALGDCAAAHSSHTSACLISQAT